VPTGSVMIRGRVRDPEGQPIRAASVYLQSGPGQFPDIAALTRDDGSFSLAVREAGAYDVGARAQGFAPGSARVVVAPGARDTAVEIQLERET
jgi:hypothetical protein